MELWGCIPQTGDEESSSPQSAVTYLIRVKTDTLAAGLLQALRGSASTDISMFD